MSSLATRTIQPLRSCTALRPLPTQPSATRFVSYWKPASGTTKPAPATARATASKVFAPRPAAATRPPPPPSAPVAGDPEPPANPILDPQAAIEPPASATLASTFAPVPEASSFVKSDVPDNTIDWSTSFHGLGHAAFSPETNAILMAPLDPEDVEVKPDGIIYLPEIKYRRILNRAFGPGAWGLAPRGELVVSDKVVTREYALVVHGRYVSQARGECQYFSDETIPTAGEGCKSNALMRCCKDLGIGSELWDPRFIRDFKKKYAQEVWVEHVVNKKKRQVWMRKGGDVAYPYKRSG